MKFTKGLVHAALLMQFLLITINAIGQSNIIRLYNGRPAGSEKWKQNEAIYYDSAVSGEQFIYNVTDPTLTVFKPDSAVSNKTAIIICPGGAFHVLGIDNEGYNVARWINSMGISAFVLKYRLAESKTKNPLKELDGKLKNFNELDSENEPVVPLAIADAKAAIRYLRQNSAKLNISPDHIGIMGFSAGGTVAAGVAFEYNSETRPNFIAPLYAYLGALKNFEVQADAPPLFVAACTDDPLGFAFYSTQMYNYWIAAKRSAEIHIFSKGGHGFAMKIQHLSVDQWRSLFKDWLLQNGYL